MSHPNPSYDPEDLSPDEIERLADRADLMHDAAVDREAERMADNYAIVQMLNHARNDDLALIAKEINPTVAHRFIPYLKEVWEADVLARCDKLLDDNDGLPERRFN
jgi:hypothetical protein